MALERGLTGHVRVLIEVGGDEERQVRRGEPHDAVWLEHPGALPQEGPGLFQLEVLQEVLVKDAVDAPGGEGEGAPGIERESAIAGHPVQVEPAGEEKGAAADMQA